MYVLLDKFAPTLIPINQYIASWYRLPLPFCGVRVRIQSIPSTLLRHQSVYWSCSNLIRCKLVKFTHSNRALHNLCSCLYSQKSFIVLLQQNIFVFWRPQIWSESPASDSPKTHKRMKIASNAAAAKSLATMQHIFNYFMHYLKSNGTIETAKIKNRKNYFLKNEKIVKTL